MQIEPFFICMVSCIQWGSKIRFNSSPTPYPLPEEHACHPPAAAHHRRVEEEESAASGPGASCPPRAAPARPGGRGAPAALHGSGSGPRRATAPRRRRGSRPRGARQRVSLLRSASGAPRRRLLRRPLARCWPPWLSAGAAGDTEPPGETRSLRTRSTSCSSQRRGLRLLFHPVRRNVDLVPSPGSLDLGGRARDMGGGGHGDELGHGEAVAMVSWI